MINSLLIIILILLILLSAALSASETSLFSLSRFTLRSYSTTSDSRKRLIAHLLRRPREVLVTIMMLNIFANILVQNTVSSLFGEFSGWIFKVGLPLFLTLFFGEIIPKSIALPNNEQVAYRLAPYVSFAYRSIGTIRIRLTKLTDYVSRIIFFFLKKEKPISSAELMHILEDSNEKGILTDEESQLIEGYLDLHDSMVKEHIRPRGEVIFYDVCKPIDELTYLFNKKRCSRLPVCNKSLDEIIGIISAKDYFVNKNIITSSKDLEKHLHKPFYIPEGVNAWAALDSLREKKLSFAVVVNEYGLVSGIVTQEDLIETVVGEISDVRDVKSLYTRSGNDVIIASGKLELDELEQIFNVRLQRETSSVTLGGYLIDKLEEIPQTGSKFKDNNLFFYVLAADPNKVKRVYIRKLKKIKKKNA